MTGHKIDNADWGFCTCKASNFSGHVRTDIFLYTETQLSYCLTVNVFIVPICIIAGVLFSAQGCKHSWFSPQGVFEKCCSLDSISLGSRGCIGKYDICSSYREWIFRKVSKHLMLLIFFYVKGCFCKYFWGSFSNFTILEILWKYLIGGTSGFNLKCLTFNLLKQIYAFWDMYFICENKIHIIIGH